MSFNMRTTSTTTTTEKSGETSPATLPVMSSEKAASTYWRKKKDEITERDLNECEREKIHLIGHIQGNSGNVLFVSFPQGKIIACDGRIRAIPWVRQRGKPSRKRRGSFSNCNKNMDAPGDVSTSCSISDSITCSIPEHPVPEEDLEVKSRELIGAYLQYWVPYKLYLQIFEAVDDMRTAKSSRTFHFFNYSGKSYAITLFATSLDFSTIGIEVESVDGREATSDFYSTLVSLGRIMEFYVDENIVKTSCDSIFNLLNSYDRGMVYQFNDDNSGEVVHEIKKDDITSSYLGMRFPASDIPMPSRKLYIKNGLRYIHDVDADDVPILDANSDSSAIDLSHCRMRAVAKPHVAYLRNMGVKSSMSIAIVVENRLWGLLAFHGYKKAFKPSLHQRIACETINSMVSVKVEALVKKAQSQRIIKLSETLLKWVQSSDAATNLRDLGEQILHVLDGDVLVGRIQDSPKEEVQTIVVGQKSLAPKDSLWDKFKTHPNRELFHINTRKELAALGITPEECPACGLAYFREGHTQIIIGRCLRSRDVRWGGNPDEPKRRVDGILHPRKSFELFMEKARQESRSWNTSDLHVIKALMDRICEHSHNRMMSLLKSDIEDANLKYYNAISKARENNNFFAQMSHDIRTPFHGVMGCLNILDESRQGMRREEVKDMINTALLSGNHMLHLLDDIINISRNKYLSHSIANEKCNYHTLALEATQSLKSLALSKQIKFNCDTHPPHDYIVITTDKTKVVQVVSNIINNAIKFSPKGNIDVQFHLAGTRKDTIKKWSKTALDYAGSVLTIKENEVLYSVESAQKRVEGMDEIESKKWMLVSVADSGCGMKPDELAEMLKPYTQSSTQCKAIQGTGLGLFICVSLCHQLGGFLACSSTPGKGSIFHVGIPVGIPDPLAVDEEIKECVQKISLPAEEIPVVGPIVVCDDNKVNLKILQRALNSEIKKRSLVIDIVQASGGQEVFDVYKETRSSILFIDYHMPNIDGLQATEMIRRFEVKNNITPAYIISYTADVTEKAAQLLLSHGTNEIMPKPPPKGFLADIVSRFSTVVES